MQNFTRSDHPVRRLRVFREKLIEAVLFLCAALSVFTTISILYILISESFPFFKSIGFSAVFAEKEWTPLFEQAKFGIWPLIFGTTTTTLVALAVAIPCGTIIAAYMSEYLKPSQRELVKPVLELLAGVPSVVFGYFALLIVTPLLQKIYPDLGGFSALSAGLVLGVMIIPYVASLSEDAMRAVPGYLREGAYALGATKLQTCFNVVIPASISGMTSAYILAISRAFGETMVVAIASGMQPNFTLNPLEPVQTMTSYIVQVSQGDLPHGSIGYQTIYVVGLCLMLITFVFNSIGLYVRNRYQSRLK